jgi:predicted metalloprotease with PDZ domain
MRTRKQSCLCFLLSGVLVTGTVDFADRCFLAAMHNKTYRLFTQVVEFISMDISVRKQGQAIGVRFWQAPDGEVMLVHKDDHGMFASSSSTKAGLKVGMTIRRINGVRCQSAADATRLLEQAPLGKNIRIEAGLPNFRTAIVPTFHAYSSSDDDRQHLSAPRDDLNLRDDLTCTDVSESDNERGGDDDDNACSDSSFTAQDHIFFVL